MNEVAVVYYSAHHGNTKKVLEAMSEVKGMDLIPVGEVKNHDLSKYKVVGLASGIFFSKLHEKLEKFANVYDFKNQTSFIVYTSGASRKGMERNISDILDQKKVSYKTFSCRGFDTYGIFKLIGGIRKGHPNDKDLNKAKEFAKSL